MRLWSLASNFAMKLSSCFSASGPVRPAAFIVTPSVPHARAVAEHDLLAGRDRDLELERVRVLAGELVRLLQDVAVARHALLDHDRHVALLAVAQLDLDRILALAVRDAALLHLVALGG